MTSGSDGTSPRPADADDALRATMRAALSSGSDADLAPLQSRVLAQWRMRTATASLATPLGGGVAGLRQHPRLLALAALALAVAVALAGSVYLKRGDPALDELIEPDVLSLIMIGEL